MPEYRPTVPLHWVVHRRNGETFVMIVRAHSDAHARLKAALDGLEGVFVECHSLDFDMAWKVPETLIGKVLSPQQAQALLKKIG
jgi:hypothetical protein